MTTEGSRRSGDVVSHRTQVVLDREQYALLKAESRRSGQSVGALIRAAVNQRFGPANQHAVAALKALERSAGVWQLEQDGESYVDGLRRAHRSSDDAPS